jgi:hypothetical protein
MTSSAVVKISTPGDIAGLIPFHVGFVPRESVVVLCLNGRRRRVGLVMRQDLVPLHLEAQLVEDLAGHVERADADAVVLAIFSEHDDTAHGLPWQHLAATLQVVLPVPAVETLLVRSGRWWSYDCVEACCPPEGTPLPDTTAGTLGRLAAETVERGRAVLPDREALVRSVRPPRNAIADAVRADLLHAAEVAHTTTLAQRGLVAAREETLALVEELAGAWAAGEQQLLPEQAARIAVGLDDLWARDRLATRALESDGSVSRSYLALLIALAQATDDLVAAPICTVLAWVAYVGGDGALANVALDRALSCRPDYSMARLLETGMAHQVHPSVVRDVLRKTDGSLDALERLFRR